MLHAKWRPGPSLKPSLRNSYCTDFASTIVPGGNPLQGCVDLIQANPALLQQCGSLRELERYGAALRVVLVVHIGVLPGKAYRTDVASQRLQQGEFAVTFLLKEKPKPLHINHGRS
ncbi:hypothetical protein D3C73_1480160 [compost metagenome]